jgi:glycosyltransferase involved in cell wall biosynthesis
MLSTVQKPFEFHSLYNAVNPVRRYDEGDAKKLNLVFFGFLAEYKGVLELMEAVNRLISEGYPVHLTVIGSEHPRLRNQTDYKIFIGKIRALSAASDSICLAGFLEDDQVDHILASCDAVVLPYKASLSASGVIGRAWAAGAAVLTSNAVHTQFGLSNAIPKCDPTIVGIRDAILSLDEAALSLARKYAASMNTERSARTIVQKTLHLYDSLMLKGKANA